ncbi:LLM class F420-dependent oxidoreductase [Mycolicibacterium litorale]|nr:LLM class F420-dependent oxidoreductase [Mycolicibacterium litorale]
MGEIDGLKVDRGVMSRLAGVAVAAREAERLGYDGIWTAEINHDPFLALTLAAEHTAEIELGTGIAVAFARNPMTVANLGWDLQEYSRGRLLLGLGTQIKPHIEKRFSMPWAHPVQRMGEFVTALHAIWDCWADGTKLSFEGDFYSHRLMTPMFTPEHQAYGKPAVLIAAVGELMTEKCGEVADGLIAHAFTTKRYFHEVTIPALRRGMAKSGRDGAGFEVSAPVFVVTGTDEAEIAAAAAGTRKQIAFYASTPAYRKVLELHGWGDLQTELRQLSLDGQWDTMATLIDDEMLATFAVVAPLDQLAGALKHRCDGIIDRVMVALPASASEETIRTFLDEVRSR